MRSGLLSCLAEGQMRIIMRSAVLLITLGFLGCGGRQVVKTEHVEMAVPPEIAKAFEVKELPPAPVAATATARALPAR